MKTALAAAVALLSASVADPAAAQVAGVWHVSGKVSSFAFTLNCTFKPGGSTLTGVCVDASTNDPKINTGKAHPLTAGSVNGDRVSWTYQSSFLFSKFDVTYIGMLKGDQMSGAIKVQGREGAFTAARQ